MPLSVPPGTFYAWDKVPALFQFVRESLVDGWQPFELIAPGGQKLNEADDVALAECNLVSTEALKESTLANRLNASLTLFPTMDF